MGITEVLTVIFVVLKLCGVISWGWFYVLFGVLHIALSVKLERDFRREFRR